jgi:hypothetical protein
MTDDTEPADITSPSGEVIAAQMFAAIDWDARLRAAVTKTITDRAARRDQRTQLNNPRAYGLAARHRNKLNRGAAMEPTLNPTDIIGAKGWCWNCQAVVVYEVGPEGNWYWQHASSSVPDDHELDEVTVTTDRIRMFQHGKAYTDTQA